MSYSILANVTLKKADGQTIQLPRATTIAFLHVRGKLLFICVNGSREDLKWTRQTSKDWSSAIRAANPSDAATAAKEAKPSRPSWEKNVSRYGLIGGVVGALIVLLFFRRRSSF
jgi:hypothetical protein